MLVRGTRRLASGLAVALVLLTLYMVFYGGESSYIPNMNLPYAPKAPPSRLPPVDPGNSNNAGKSATDRPDNPLTPPGSDTVPVKPTYPGPVVDAGDDDSKKSISDLSKPNFGELPATNPINELPIDLPGKTTEQKDKLEKPDKPEKAEKPEKTATDKTPAAVTSSAEETETVFIRPPQNFDGPTKFVSDTHREIFARTTKEGQYWEVDFSPWPAYNPNFTPHPTKNDTWITVAQYHKTKKDNQVWFTQIICEAKFQGNALKCTHPPWTVPIPPTWSDKCEGEIAHFNFNIGPHDARVFYGPKRPYILYGSQSSYSCFGQWFQDFTLVSDWPGTRAGDFRAPTEIQRPPPHKYGVVEKNWFLFWDDNDEIWVHHDIYPERVFGKMSIDGKVKEDAVVPIAASEKKCLDKLLPYAQKTYAESIHQATNSLSIVMCKRSDPTCVKSASNTFVFHIFHWKSFYEFHGLYEPYVHMFSRHAPFETYAVSQKPLWFRGRRLPGTWRAEGQNGWNQTEMVYTTSIAWKDYGMTYEGYLDDVLLLGFGIEDKECGGMDVLAADIFQDLATCDGSTPPKMSL